MQRFISIMLIVIHIIFKLGTMAQIQVDKNSSVTFLKWKSKRKKKIHLDRFIFALTIRVCATSGLIKVN